MCHALSLPHGFWVGSIVFCRYFFKETPEKVEYRIAEQYLTNSCSFAFNHGINLHNPTISIVFIIMNIAVSTIVIA